MTNATSTIVEFKSLPSTAEGWCARLHADDVTDLDRRAFESWLATSIDNRAEYELCTLTFALAHGLPAAPQTKIAPLSSGTSVHADEESPRRSRGPRRRLASAAAAASVAVAAGLLSWWLAAPRYATGVGEQKLIALTDGSTVQLNTATAIGVDLQQTARQVTLRWGEAFFNIAPDPQRPFVVKAGAGEIRVVGTKFNVRVAGATAVVTVVEGHVKVSGSRGRPASGAAMDLLAGEAVAVAPERAPARQPAVDPAKSTSWREGKIQFERDPLSAVIAEVNRYSEAQFAIDDPAVRALTLTGVFRTGDVDAVAFALRESYGLKTQRSGNRISVSR